MRRTIFFVHPLNLNPVPPSSPHENRLRPSLSGRLEFADPGENGPAVPGTVDKLPGRRAKWSCAAPAAMVRD